MVIDFNKKCGHCGHRSLKHRDFTKTCKECSCQAFIVGGKPAPSVTRYTQEEVQVAARVPMTRKGPEPEPHKVVGDIGSELSREFRRLTNKKRGGKS